jgi:Ca2+-binding RTX toxin-like protein
VSTHLTLSAVFKSNEMADYSYFDHRSSVTGMWPNALVRAHGYPLPGIFVNDANNVESLHVGSPVAADVLESFADSPGHRAHIFGDGWFVTHLDIGVGRSDHDNYWTVHTAYSDTTSRAVTGVVYADDNGNGRMDIGEGLGGILVEVGDATTRTSAGGGWSVKVRPGTHFVRVGDVPRFDGPSWATVRVSEWNVGVEFVSGVRRALVHEYHLCRGLEPTILGTSRDDILVGTAGRDIIHGLGGDDTIDGRGGDDVICGGAGDDVVIGSDGRDLLVGQAGADDLDGGSGWDQLWGGGGYDECHGGEASHACEATA